MCVWGLLLLLLVGTGRETGSGAQAWETAAPGSLVEKVEGICGRTPAGEGSKGWDVGEDRSGTTEPWPSWRDAAAGAGSSAEGLSLLLAKVGSSLLAADCCAGEVNKAGGSGGVLRTVGAKVTGAAGVWAAGGLLFAGAGACALFAGA